MVQKSLLNGDPIQIAKQFKTALTKAHFPAKAIYIFGSYSKKTERWDSDLDIAVVTNHQNPTIIDQMNLATIASTVSDMIEPHLIDKADFDNHYHTLSQEIKQHGISV
jgi:predicted nucleotidyltransferase